MLVIAPLEQFVVAELFTFLVLLLRLGAFFMILPGIGDLYVPTRIRLLLTITISLALVPMLSVSMPAPPESAITFVILIATEILVGVFFGTIVRFLMTTMNVTGAIIANQSTLAIASIFEATAGIQTAIVSNFFTLGALTLFFALDLHHILIAAIIQSYNTFPAGTWLEVGDSANYLAKKLSEVFLLAVQFAAPTIVMGLLLYVAAGVMARLMPTFQVFFVMLPAQITLSLIMIATVIPPMMAIYGNYLEDQFLSLITAPIKDNNG